MLSIRSDRTISRTSRRKRRLVGVVVAIAVTVTVGPFASPVDADPLGDARIWNESTANVQVNGTYVPVTGLFTADTGTDVLWFDATGRDQFWRRGDDGRHRSLAAPPQIDGARIPLVGDFAGNDALDDIFWYGPGAVTDVLWRSKGDGTFAVSSFVVNGAYTPKVVHSNTGADIVWWKKGWSTTSVWDFGAARGTFTNRTLTNPASAEPVPGDFNGDGIGDIFWYSPGIDAESISRGTGGIYTTMAAPSVHHGERPVVVRLKGFGGIGHDHILWWSTRNPEMAVWRADTGFRWTGMAVKVNTSATTTPIPLPGTQNTYLWNWDTVGGDHLWLREADGRQLNVGTANTEPGAGAIPIPLATHGATSKILWYAPGFGTDVMFSLLIAAP